jgi:hypothetical protein
LIGLFWFLSDLGGIGGERLSYRPKDDWECRRSTEERHGWSSRQTRVPTVREQILGTSAPGLPDWIKKERQVLHFESFFLETVDSDRVETERVRKCHLYFYLEDETLQVVEPAVPNSGIPQGRLPHSNDLERFLDFPYYFPTKLSRRRYLGPPTPGPLLRPPRGARRSGRPAEADAPRATRGPHHLLGPQSR